MKLSRLQRRILALLEEACEENPTTLTNSVALAYGNPWEIGAMTKALKGLLAEGLIELATELDPRTHHWIPHPTDTAAKILHELQAHVQWDPTDHIWAWHSPHPRPSVLLTDTGLTLSRQILDEEGWPVNKLDSFETR